MLVSDYFMNAWWEHVAGGDAYTQPTLHLALFTEIPVPSDPTPAGEVSGGDYARQEITWAAAANGRKLNSAAVTFPPPTADWADSAAPIVAVVLMDASTDGNWLLAEVLCEPRIVVNGSRPPKFDIGSLKLMLAGQGGC